MKEKQVEKRIDVAGLIRRIIGGVALFAGWGGLIWYVTAYTMVAPSYPKTIIDFPIFAAGFMIFLWLGVATVTLYRMARDYVENYNVMAIAVYFVLLFVIYMVPPTGVKHVAVPVPVWLGTLHLTLWPIVVIMDLLAEYYGKK